MKFDVVFLSYNSEKWIQDCNKAMAELDYNLKDINIIYVDNLSKDNSYKMLLEEQKKYENTFGSFKVIKSEKNLGFGVGNNLGAKER